MNGRIDAERILDAYLAPENDRLPDRVLDAALAAISRTPQRRAVRVPWRFPNMPALSRATGIAAVALVAVVGAGSLIFLNAKAPGGPGGPATLPPATQSPTAAPTPAASGIADWKMYTSEVYGITFGYPDHWREEALATRAWQAGDTLDWNPSNDIFISPDGQIALAVFQVTAEPGADIGSREGLGAIVCELDAIACQPIEEAAEPMCLGRDACLPAAVVPLPEGVVAYFADAETRKLTVVTIGQPDDYPPAAQYGGSVQLLKSILTTMDAWTPQPGQIPG
jgi:hypothetical protein